jgi:hypothetical protein
LNLREDHIEVLAAIVRTKVQAAVEMEVLFTEKKTL